MAVKNLEFPKFRYTVVKTDANGNSYLSPASGYKVYTYEAGTTTLLTTYSDFDLTTPNANPIILGADGSANIFFDERIKIDLLSDVDVRVTGFPVDDISTGGEVTVTGNFNAVLNGDFEISTDSLPESWTLSPHNNGTILIDTTAAASGSQSLKFTGAGSGGGTITSAIFAVPINADILVEFSYKASAAASTNVVTTYWYKPDGTASATASTTVHTISANNPAAFTRYRYSVDVPSDATQATVSINGVSSGGGELSSNATFDNVVVITSTYLVPDTLGTVQANKVVVADSNKDVVGFRKITGSTSTGYTAEFTYTGTTENDAAVLGNITSASGSSFAVYGLNASATGRAVRGYSTHATGANMGVSGRTDSNTGYAGHFRAIVAGGLPLYAEAFDAADIYSALTLRKGTHSLSFNPRHSASLNPIIETSDQVIMSTGADLSIDTGVLTLAPYAQNAVGIRIDSTDDTVTISGTTTISALAGYTTSGTGNYAICNHIPGPYSYTSTSWTKQIEWLCGQSGTVDVQFTFDLGGGVPSNVYAAIYVNGVQVGTSRHRTNPSTPTIYNEVITVATGDLLQIYTTCVVGTSPAELYDIRVLVDSGAKLHLFSHETLR